MRTSPPGAAAIALPAIGRPHCALADQVPQPDNRGIHDSIRCAETKIRAPASTLITTTLTRSPRRAGSSFLSARFLSTWTCKMRKLRIAGKLLHRGIQFEKRLRLPFFSPSKFLGILVGETTVGMSMTPPPSLRFSISWQKLLRRNGPPV